MYSGIIAIENSKLRNECSEVLSKFESIRIKYVNPLETLSKDLTLNSLFLIINNLENSQLVDIINKEFPKFPIIFYNHSLMLSKKSIQIPQSNFYFVVGIERKQHLENLIGSLLKNHWRKIPYQKMNIDYENLSPRMKQVLDYIETNDLHQCDIIHLSNYLNITPGYFSQLFKNETGQSFRQFMQKIINYYENLLFLDWGLGVKNVSRLLGYSELSSFSRSFKNRKGQSPRAYTKLKIQSE